MKGARAWSFAKRAYVLAVMVFLAWAVHDAGAAFSDWRAWLTPGSGLFVLGWMCMAGTLGMAWALVLRGFFDLRLSISEWLPIQAAAWAGRYLPGKIGLLAGKMSVLERPGMDWRGLGFSVLFEQLAFVSIGTVFALLLPWPERISAWWQSWFPAISRVVAAPAIAVGVLACFILAIRWLVARSRAPLRPGPLVAVAIFSCHVAAHVVVGLGFFALASGKLPPGSDFNVVHAVGLLALANVAGILAFFAPAGLGVREAVIVAGLSTHLPVQEALAIAAFLRLLTMLADALFFVLGGGALRLHASQARSEG